MRKIQFIKMIIFFSVFILLSINGVDVKAAGTGGSFKDKKVNTLVNTAEPSMQTNLNSKTIYANSVDLGYFHFGMSESFIKLRNEFKALNGENYKGLDLWNYIAKNYQNIIGVEVYAFPDTIIFNETSCSKRYPVTAYLYLYCDEGSFKEYAENVSSIAEGYYPLYFQEDDDTEGELMLQVQAFYFYYPVSSMQSNNKNAVYSQLYDGTKNKELAQKTIEAAYSNAVSPHSVNDFSGASGKKDILIYDKILPAKYSWVMCFLCGSQNEDRFNGIGSSYLEQEKYPLSNATVTKGINEAKAIVPALPIPDVSKTTSDCYALKIYTQQEGIDKIFSGLVSGSAASRVGWQKLIRKDALDSKLLNAEALMLDIYDRVGDERITQKNILSLYNTAIENYRTDVPSAFISIDGQNFFPRYVFGAVPTSLLCSSDCCFTRDVTPNNAFSESSSLSGRLNTSLSQLHSNSLTRMFGDYGNVLYKSAIDEDKIKSMLVIIQVQPGIFTACVSHNAELTKMLGGSQGANALKKLNEIGATDRDLWKKIILRFGDYMLSHCLLDNLPSNGWSSSSSWLTNSGKYYELISFGLSIIPESKPVEKKEDLVLSNSYNHSLDTTIQAEGTTLLYSSSRPVIDWTPLITNGLDLSGLGKGGKSIPEEVETTKIKNQPAYFDIYTGAKGLSSGKLTQDSHNIASIGNNNSDVKAFAEGVNSNSDKHAFRTVFFVGRIPEANKTTTVSINDFTPTVFARYNAFDIVYDAGFDDNYNARNTLSIELPESKGTALNLLSSSISYFSTDYDGNSLVQNYYSKGLNQNYNNSWKFGVTAKPIGILRCDQNSLENYASYEYKTEGPEATGYDEIKMANSFVPVGNNTEINPGDVVAYDFTYNFPSQQALSKSLNSSGSKKLINTGNWYTEYETILMTDLNVELLPSSKLKERDWQKINANTGNDWIKERLIAPILHNVFFTSVKVEAVGGESFEKTGRPSSEGINIISQSKLNDYDFGLPWLIAPVGKDEYGTFDGISAFKYHFSLKPNKSTVDYGVTKATVKFSWEYVTALPLLTININKANRVTFENTFKRTSGEIKGVQSNIDKVGNATNFKSYDYNQINPNLTIEPNLDILNYGKGEFLKLSIPNSDVNNFHYDWEHIIISFDVAPKDNSVDDLLLLYNNNEVAGDININRINGGGAQAIDYKQGGTYTLYAIVRRNKPDISWEEKVSGKKWGGEQIGCFEYSTNENGTQAVRTTSSVVTSIPVRPTFPIAIKNLNGFKNPGDTLIFKTQLPSNIMYLEATFHYRDASSGINQDYEDIDLENNVWSESWSAKYPDFAVEVNQDFKSVFERGSCGSQRSVSPNYTIIVTQANPFYEGGGGPVTVNTNLDGWTVASGTTSGNKIIWYWGGGMEQNSYHITYKERKFPYQSPTFNQEFVFRAEINPERKYKEININNNYAKSNFSVTLDCSIPTETPITPCTAQDWERLGCKYKYGVGKQYKWNVKFQWSQQNPEKTTSTNVYVQHYMEDVYASDGNGGSVYVGQREVCPCYCDPSPVTGPNNGVRFWRTDFGHPLYYEVHTMQIHLLSTNKATTWGYEGSNDYDITGGTGYVSGGMMWNVYFDAKYESDRGSMPRAMYSPFSQPYSTGNGGSGCPTCNWLHRWPNPENVQGPRHVLIKYRGLQVIAPKDYEYSSPQQVISNGYVNKWYRWQPIKNMMAMTKENTRQTLHISITSYAFTGHIFDTWNSVDGTGHSAPGYGWQSRTFHCFCDTVSATVEFVPPKAYIASAVSPEENAQGLDGYVPGYGEKVEKRESGVEGTDLIETDNDQWMY